ncbi:MAG: hypothetical protein ACHREM_24135, partial [Polyangiales bacterium]
MRAWLGALGLVLAGSSACVAEDSATPSVESTATTSAETPSGATSPSIARVTLARFTGRFDSRRSSLSLQRRPDAPVVNAGAGEPRPFIPLPVGDGPGTVSVHVDDTTTTWDPHGTLCPGASGDPALCVRVEIVSAFAEPIFGVRFVIDSQTPSYVTAADAPYEYGTLYRGAESSFAAKPDRFAHWSFVDPPSTDFQFEG